MTVLGANETGITVEQCSRRLGVRSKFRFKDRTDIHTPGYDYGEIMHTKRVCSGSAEKNRDMRHLVEWEQSEYHPSLQTMIDTRPIFSSGYPKCLIANS